MQNDITAVWSHIVQQHILLLLLFFIILIMPYMAAHKHEQLTSDNTAMYS